MILGVDLRCLPADGSPGRGVEHASRELWSALRADEERYGLRCIGFAPQGATLSDETSIIFLPDASSAQLRSAIKNHPIDALLVPAGAVPWGISVPCYPWVHDCAIFKHPEWFPQSWFKRQLTTWLFLRGLKRAHHIFTISASTKQEVCELLPHLHDRLTVTGQGIRLSASLNDRAELVHAPYILMLGPTEERKNVSFVLQLRTRLQDVLEPQHISWVIAGRRGWDDHRSSEAWEGVTRIEQFTDEDRDMLLRHASLLLIPSWHEGFSRVALEGMAMGIPVIASDRAALPEVIGTGGRCLPLERPAEWEQMIKQVIQGAPWVEALKKAALERSKWFSWEKTAQIILAKISSG